MCEGIRRALWGTAGVIVFAAVVSVPIVGKPQPPTNWTDLGDAWANFVYNYQTLITGLAAVGAAVVTVRQMRESDSKEEWRFRRQVYLDTRNEVSAAQRIIVRLVPKLEILQECVARFCSHMTDVSDVGTVGSTRIMQSWTIEAKDEYFQALRSVLQLQKALDETPASELETLSPNAERTLQDLKTHLLSAGSVAKSPLSVVALFVNSDHAPMNYNDEIGNVLAQLGDTAKELAIEIQESFKRLLKDVFWD